MKSIKKWFWSFFSLWRLFTDTWRIARQIDHNDLNDRKRMQNVIKARHKIWKQEQEEIKEK